MNKLIDFILHPFRYLGGWPSVAVGGAIVLISAFVSSLSGVHFPDVLSVKVGSTISFIDLLKQALVNWTVLATMFYIAGLLFSQTKPRFVDVAGTLAVARFPYLLASFTGFGGALLEFGNYIIAKQLTPQQVPTISMSVITIAILLLILQIVLTVWMVALMYQAFAVSVNLKGGKCATVFTVTLIVTVIVSNLCNYLIFNCLK